MQCTNLSCSPGSLRVRHHNIEMVGMAGKIKGKEYAVGKSKNGRTDAMHLLAIKLSINSSERCSSCKFNGSKLAVNLISTVLFHHFPNQEADCGQETYRLGLHLAHNSYSAD